MISRILTMTSRIPPLWIWWGITSMIWQRRVLHFWLRLLLIWVNVKDSYLDQLNTITWAPQKAEKFPWPNIIIKAIQLGQILCDPMDYTSPWNSPGQNIGVGSLSLLQGIFQIQGLNPGLPHCRQILYQLSYQGSPRILEWVAYPFSSGSSPPRNWTRFSCTAGGFFTNCAMRETLPDQWKKGKSERYES